MNARRVSIVALIALLGLTACGTIQYREGRGTYCRQQTHCPWENN
jgi:hypothetical protein